jgi:peptide/nickel transport system substrate-binding protein
MNRSVFLGRRGMLRLGAGGLLASGTGRSWAEPHAAVVAAPASDVLQITGPWEIGGLAPAASGYIFCRLQVTETLLDAADDGTPRPGLAQRWSSSPDGLVWRFELRPGARFHDGTAVTAQAAVRCLEAARTAPALLSRAPLRDIVAQGRSTVLMRLSTPFAALTDLLAHSSTLVLAPSSYRSDGSIQAIVGSGPYRVRMLAPPQQVQTQAFEGFDGPAPAIAQVRYTVASRAETRALMAESGQSDLAYALEPTSLQRLSRRGKLQVQTVTLARTVILKVNAAMPMLSDVRVRQALSLGIDRRGIATALLRDPTMAATQLFPPTLTAWHDAQLQPLRHDPALAARLLMDAGWRRANDGLRDAQGRPFTLALRTFPDRPELPLIATALQEQWRQAGMAVRVQVGNSGDIPLGHRDGSLELALAARNYATVPDPAGTLAQDFSATGGDWGAMGWRSQALEAALASLLRGEQAAPAQARLRREVVGVLHAKLPVIPITWYRQQVAVSARLSGVSLDPLERSYRLTDMRWRT